MRRVELFELIRKDHYLLGESIRGISRKRGIHRRMVREALASAIPPEPKKPVRKRPVMTEEVVAFIDRILEDDKHAPKKQRHTARRIWQRLGEEKGCTAAESTVRQYVRKRKRELAIGVEAYVPQHHEPGEQGEVDLFESEVIIAGEQLTAQIVTLRSEFSAGAHHAGYPAATQSALLDGVAKGFEFFGGSFKVARLDNLKLAVARVLKGKRRVQQDRFVAFRSHYLFEASFTSPGIQGAHEKGGVENEGGRFRRRWLTPVPSFDSWEQFNDYLLACSVNDLDRKLDGRAHTVGELVAIEQPLLRPLPAERFETGVIGLARVDQKSRICARTNRYSVPATLVGRVVSWRMTPLSLEVFAGQQQVATHDVLHTKCGESLQLDHYLEVLQRKPGAMPGSLPLHQARISWAFPPSYDALWKRLQDRIGESAGTKAMIEVLLLHRTHADEVVKGAVEVALEVGALDPTTIALLARRAVAAAEELPEDLLEVGPLGRYDRPVLEISGYDRLLNKAVAK